MCLPKAPKTDPNVKKQQALQAAAEQARLKEEKDKQLVATKRSLRGSGLRSLLSGQGSGIGNSYL